MDAAVSWITALPSGAVHMLGAIDPEIAVEFIDMRIDLSERRKKSL